MKNLASYLLVIFMVMFWIFRLIVAFSSTMGLNIGIVPMDLNMEIILLFVTMLSIILVIKRKVVGALIYLISYGMYFGVYLYKVVITIIQGSQAVSDYGNAFISFIGVLLPIVVLFELLLDKNRKKHPVDKKTDWFYKNEQFDRKLDERADKNNYRMY